MTYVIKDVDEDGLQVLLTSDRVVKKWKRRESSGLVKYVRKNFNSGGSDSCRMELCLSRLLEYVFDHQSKRRRSSHLLSWAQRQTGHRGVIIYVLTTGRWTRECKDDNLSGGANNPIITLVNKMRTNGMNRTDIVLQFVQFGDDIIGQRRLEYLDNGQYAEM